MVTCGTAANTFLQEQLDVKKTQLSAANLTMTGLLEKEIQSYQLDTTEGEQRVTRQRIDRLAIVIERLEADILQLIRKLQGCGGLLNLNMRRQL